MKICYIAKHNSGHNDDEGAILYALKTLGHDVVPVYENLARDYIPDAQVAYDLYLFHKFSDVAILKILQGRPGVKAFWYFDLVNAQDQSVAARSQQRRAWMNTVLPYVDIGFCTDGDWVANDTSGKLVTLRQGYDQRLLPADRPANPEIDILVPCTLNRCGVERGRWFIAVNEWATEKGYRLFWVKNLFRNQLAFTVANSKVILAPAHPVTDRYWSNRVYNIMGLGGPLVHPWAEQLEQELHSNAFPSYNQPVLFYHDSREMFSLLNDAIHLDSEWRTEIGDKARSLILSGHTYRHRCETLISTITQRFYQ